MPWPYTSGARAHGASALIDEWLPKGAWKLEHHALEMPCTPAQALDAFYTLRNRDLPLVHALMSMRGISAHDSKTMREFFSTPPFITLAENPGREMVGGIPGPFWHFGHGRLPADLPSSPDAFREVLAGGRIAAIANFAADPLSSGGSRLWTETWAYAPKPGDRRLFTAYWLAIGPFSALIRRAFLTAAKRRAEAAAGARA